MAYDDLKLLETSKFFCHLSKSYEDKAGDLATEWKAGDRELTAREGRWLEFLVNYSRTLRFFSEEAERLFDHD